MKRLLATFAVVLLILCTGCASYKLPPDQRGSFRADENHFMMKSPTITWRVVEDVHKECTLQLHATLTSGQYLACAIPDVKANTCEVITSTQTSHALFGHEVRHCFAGAFHN